MASFAQGTYVFIPDEEDCYIAAKVESAFTAGSAGAVKLVESGRRVKLSSNESKGCRVMDAQSLDPVSDMVSLKSLDEASILHNLRLRFHKDEIYTNIGSILVSVNPFKALPIYTPEVVEEYVRHGARDMPPHIFGVADNAFRSLTGFGKSQSCIISGESGAGKTEATKLFLQYIGERSGGATAKSATLQHQILEANPLLEAFGNAKTVRNDNSSRFGKLIQVHMNPSSGSFTGGSITSYLLEKSRIVSQPEGERNYHVFYQLCATASMNPEMTAKYDLVDADQYFYLNQSQEEASTIIPGVNDAHEWENTVAAMETLGISEGERESIIRTLAGILHLGNIRFTGSEEKSSVENKEMLTRAAEQLGATPDALEKALTMRNRGNARESVFSNQGVNQAAESRDALAKAVYNLLFDWIIDRINNCLGGDLKGDQRIIGVLDIFGFESFKHNSFEQLCINYCNEKLQGHFNEHIFRLEQEEYKKEGIDVSKIDFVDNSAVLNTIEQKGTGLFALLTEQNKLPRGSDEAFLSKALGLAGNGVLEKPDQKSMRSNKEGARFAFVVVHYAGPVSYDSRGFLVKNGDLLLNDLATLGSKSSFKFVADLFNKQSKGSKKGAADPNKSTISTQFKEQLAALMKTLNSTEPHYVRCIKSNEQKKGGIFNAPMILDQMNCAGLLEVCRIRATGYPVRRDFKEFLIRYRTLAPSVAKDHKALAAQLEKDGILAKDQYQVGKSKMFFRTDQFNDLEAVREKSVTKQATLLQKVARGFVARRRYATVKQFRANLAKAVKSRDAKKLEAVLLEAGVLPYHGRHLAEVQDAKKLLDLLHEEERVTAMLEEAMEAADLSALQTALKAATNVGLSKSSDVVKRAEKAVQTIEKQKEARTALRNAVDKRDAKALAAAIKTAAGLKMQKTPEYMDAEALSAKLKEEAATLSKLEAAVKKKDVNAIKALFGAVAELGLEGHSLVQQAQGVAKAEAKRSAAAEQRMRALQEQLDEAIERRDLPSLELLCRQAIEIGMKGKSVDDANRLRAELQGKADVVANVTAEMKALEIRSKSHNGITEKDIEPLSKAIQRAADSGISTDEEEMQEAIQFEERMFKQVSVQQEVDNALAQNVLSAMKSVVSRIMEVGLETGTAKKILAEVRAQESYKSKEDRDKAVQRRLEKRSQLRQATAEERLKESLTRLVKASSDVHSERIREASDNNRYAWTKFYKIRSDEDFTEFTHQDMKTHYAEFKLRFQSKVIPKSLLEMDDDLSKIAVQNFKAILQYCGDLSTSFPATMAGYVLVRGQENPDLVDEIYCQLMKQLIDNKKPLSEDRAWGLMCMATKTFPPSAEFEPYLLNFLVNRRADPGLIGNYARLCIVQLDATIDLGASQFLPDMDSIEAYSSRPPILASISMMDGSILDVPVSPDQDVGYVLEIANQHADISEDDMPLYSIFVIDEKQRMEMDLRTRLIRFYQKYNPSKLPYVDHFALTWMGNESQLFATLEKKYGPEPTEDEDVLSNRINATNKKEKKGLLRLPVTAGKMAAKMLGLAAENSAPPPSPQVPWNLPFWAFLGDVYIRMVKQGRQPVFTHKRLIIFPSEKMTDGLFHQVREEVREGDLPILDDPALAKLTAIDLAIENDGKKVKGKAQQDLIVELLPVYALRRTAPSDWENLVKEAQNGLPKNVNKLKKEYFEVVKGCKFFGYSFYYAQDHGTDTTVVIGLNVDGVHILDEQREKIIKTYPFTRIARFGASGTVYWMQVADKDGQRQYYYKTVTPWSIYSAVYSITHAAADRLK